MSVETHADCLRNAAFENLNDVIAKLAAIVGGCDGFDHYKASYQIRLSEVLHELILARAKLKGEA